jgi:hypothetical protein
MSGWPRTAATIFSLTAPMGAVRESTTQPTLATQQKCEKLWTLPLFLKALQAQSKNLPQLVSPHLGNRAAELAALERLAPQFQPANGKQIAALPLGSRIEVDPWNDHIRMMRNQPVALLYAREKMPFELAPFYLDLQRMSAESPSAAPASLAGCGDFGCGHLARP